MNQVFRAFSALAGLALSLGATACTKAPEPQVVDAVTRDEFQELRRDVSKLLDSYEAANRAAGVAGLEASDLGARLMRIDARMKALEDGQAQAKNAGGATGTDPAAPSGASDGSAADPLVPPGASPSADVPFTEEQVAVARRIIDEVDRRKEQERNEERVKQALTRISVSLTPDQEKAVTALVTTYQQKMRDVFRGGFGRSDDERRVATEKVEALRASWENDLRNIVPAADADKVMEGMGRNGFPGFMPRRMGDGTRGGMGGGMGDGN